jgi:hypothetical protein
MAIPPIRYADGTDWVLTTAGIRPYPKAAKELMEFAESRGWWAINAYQDSGALVRVAPDGFTHRIRVEVGRAPIMGRNGYRYMILWTSEVNQPHAQFHVNKIMAISTEWDGWISVPGVSDVMAKMNRFPMIAPPVSVVEPGTGGDQTKIDYQCYGRA